MFLLVLAVPAHVIIIFAGHSMPWIPRVTSGSGVRIPRENIYFFFKQLLCRHFERNNRSVEQRWLFGGRKTSAAAFAPGDALSHQGHQARRFFPSMNASVTNTDLAAGDSMPPPWIPRVKPGRLQAGAVHSLFPLGISFATRDQPRSSADGISHPSLLSPVKSLPGGRGLVV
jgi:hypothetical protein